MRRQNKSRTRKIQRGGSSITFDTVLQRHLEKQAQEYIIQKDPLFEQKKKEYLLKRSEEIEALREEIKRLSDPDETKVEFDKSGQPVSIEDEKAALQKAKEDYDRLQAIVRAIEEGLSPTPVPQTKWYDSYRDMVSRISLYRSKISEVEDALNSKLAELEITETNTNEGMKHRVYWENFFNTEKIRWTTAAETQQGELDALLKDYKENSLLTSQADLEKARLAYTAAKEAIDLKQLKVDVRFQQFLKEREEDISIYHKRLIEILSETKNFLEENLVTETKEQLLALSEKSKIELVDLKKKSDGELYDTQSEALSGKEEWQRKRATERLPDLQMAAEKDRSTLLEKYKEYEDKILGDAEINWNSIQSIYFDELKEKNDWNLVKPTRFFDLMVDSSKKQTEVLKAKADLSSFTPSQQIVEDSLRQEGAAKLALDSATVSGNKDLIAASQKAYDASKVAADKARLDTATASQLEKDLKIKEETLLSESLEMLNKRKADSIVTGSPQIPSLKLSDKASVERAAEILESLPVATTPEYKAAVEAIERARELLKSIPL